MAGKYSKHPDELIRRFTAKPGKKFRLKDHDPGWARTGTFRDLAAEELKDRAKAYVEENNARLAEAQERLWASDSRSVLLVLQAMDAAGKDGAIKHVMSGVNPQGCQVHSFKKPSAEELDHSFLWRYMKSLPERGKIVIFNRSHYEDVLVVRVHPEILETSKLPKGKRGKEFWNARYEDINNLERHLVRNGTEIVKIFLHLSKGEQKRRFLDRLANPDKHWKFSLADLAERDHWDAYQEAFEQMIRKTSTEWAPWYVVPADHKWVARALISGILSSRIDALGLEYPKVDAATKARLADAKKKLSYGVRHRS